MKKLHIQRIMLDKAPKEGNRIAWFPTGREVRSIQVKFDEKKQREWIDIEYYVDGSLAKLID